MSLAHFVKMKKIYKQQSNSGSGVNCEMRNFFWMCLHGIGGVGHSSLSIKRLKNFLMKQQSNSNSGPVVQNEKSCGVTCHVDVDHGETSSGIFCILGKLIKRSGNRKKQLWVPCSVGVGCGTWLCGTRSKTIAWFNKIS